MFVRKLTPWPGRYLAPDNGTEGGGEGADSGGAEGGENADPAAAGGNGGGQGAGSGNTADGGEGESGDLPLKGAALRTHLKTMERQLQELRQENEGHRRRAEEERKAKLTEEQRIREERNEYLKRAEDAERQLVEKDVRLEFGIPAAIPLIGTDEAALRAHAEEIKKLLPKPAVGRTTQPTHEGNGGSPRFKRSQLKDPVFFEANKTAIMQAMRDGSIDYNA